MNYNRFWLKAVWDIHDIALTRIPVTIFSFQTYRYNFPAHIHLRL